MIKDLYYGNIVRADHTPTSPEYHALMQKWLPMCDAFEKMLTPEQLTVPTLPLNRSKSQKKIYKNGEKQVIIY